MNSDAEQEQRREAGTRTTQGCSKPPGYLVPAIDRNRCEGKGACKTVCPMGVLTIGKLPESDRVGLTMRGKVKGFVHGWKQALLTNANACEACGQCVKACPESAITLVRGPESEVQP